MKKSLSLFLLGVVFLLAPLQGKSKGLSKMALKDNAIYSAVKKPTVQYLYSLSDSLKAESKDTVAHKKHRLVAALLAFPLGVFGLHRIYLGSSKKVPWVYVVTIGGGFGILPFIDFVMILLSRDKEFHTKYTNNHYLFMWHKK